ncbi:GL19046 [Drosophila persimilis]|uniref:GL19046 n=1 Tax=Drosophila persimilis TaxID=7234 RepID=B4G6S9_DROPE|nr:GL19046 [Drosophila persimilis]
MAFNIGNILLIAAVVGAVAGETIQLQPTQGHPSSRHRLAENIRIPSPPCPKNYLFSCQPSLQPVPCSAPAPSYGSAGAYSQYVPQYAVPYVREFL